MSNGWRSTYEIPSFFRTSCFYIVREGNETTNLRCKNNHFADKIDLITLEMYASLWDIFGKTS